MKMLLKKILEKFVMAIFCLVIILGNMLLIYNIVNKYKPVNEVFGVSEIITNSPKSVFVRDVSSDNTVVIDTQEEKDKLKSIFDNMKIRESKLNLIDKNQKIDYTVFISYHDSKELFISVCGREIMINDVVYTCDFNVNSKFVELFK